MSERWDGLRQTRTLVAEATFIMPSGRVRAIALTKRQLLELLGDAAHALAKIERAEQMNRDRDEAIRAAYQEFGDGGAS